MLLWNWFCVINWSYPDVILPCIRLLSLTHNNGSFACSFGGLVLFIRGLYVRITNWRTPIDNAISFPTGPSFGPKRMGISNTAECQAADGSCSLRADCDITLNKFQGMCDNTTFGCCISNDIVSSYLDRGDLLQMSHVKR